MPTQNDFPPDQSQSPEALLAACRKLLIRHAEERGSMTKSLHDPYFGSELQRETQDLLDALEKSGLPPIQPRSPAEALQRSPLDYPTEIRFRCAYGCYAEDAEGRTVYLFGAVWPIQGELPEGARTADTHKNGHPIAIRHYDTGTEIRLFVVDDTNEPITGHRFVSRDITEPCVVYKALHGDFGEKAMPLWQFFGEMGPNGLEGGAYRPTHNMPMFTVGQMREALEGLPEDMLVYYQRIEDIYFEEHGWTGKVLPFEDDTSEYLSVHWAGKHHAADVFVIEAHY